MSTHNAQVRQTLKQPFSLDKRSGAAARGHAQTPLLNFLPCWPRKPSQTPWHHPSTNAEVSSQFNSVSFIQKSNVEVDMLMSARVLLCPAGITGLLLRILECRIFSSTHSSCLGTKASIIPGEEGVRWTGRGRLPLITLTKLRSTLSGWNTDDYIWTFKVCVHPICRCDIFKLNQIKFQSWLFSPHYFS